MIIKEGSSFTSIAETGKTKTECGKEMDAAKLPHDDAPEFYQCGTLDRKKVTLSDYADRIDSTTVFYISSVSPKDRYDRAYVGIHAVTGKLYRIDDRMVQQGFFLGGEEVHEELNLEQFIEYAGKSSDGITEDNALSFIPEHFTKELKKKVKEANKPPKLPQIRSVSLPVHQGWDNRVFPDVQSITITVQMRYGSSYCSLKKYDNGYRVSNGRYNRRIFTQEYQYLVSLMPEPIPDNEIGSQRRTINISIYGGDTIKGRCTKMDGKEIDISNWENIGKIKELISSLTIFKIIPQPVVEKQILLFGKYSQKRDWLSDNMYKQRPAESLEWLILEREKGKMLLVSKYALDHRCFDKERNIKWRGSDIRKWLNNSFLNTAFDHDEQKLIISNERNGTFEKVFLLSKNQVTAYMETSAERICYPTELADSEGDTRIFGCNWMLYTNIPFEDRRGDPSVNSVNGFGEFDTFPSENNSVFIRPAIWVRDVAQDLKK